MQDKKYRVIVIACFALFYIAQSIFSINPADIGYSSDSPFHYRLWYLFFHANFIHLACNCYALYFCLNFRLLKPVILIPVLYSIAVLSTFPIQTVIPTVGVSAAVFGMVGMNMYGCTRIIYWFYIAASLLVGFLLPSINGIIHLAGFLLGYLTGCSIIFFRKITYDYRAINRGK